MIDAEERHALLARLYRLAIDPELTDLLEDIIDLLWLAPTGQDEMTAKPLGSQQ